VHGSDTLPWFALHTAVGAVWKLSNPEQTVLSLSAIPHPVWLGMSVVELELVCAVALVLPAFSPAVTKLRPMAALFIVGELLCFVVLHLASGPTEYGSVIYWLVVAALCAFLAWGRLVLKPR
jgi:xanthine/uracil/vitamin C permease (AzgA family)